MWLLVPAASAGTVPEDAGQLVLVVVPTEDASRAELTRWTHDADGWHVVADPIPVRTGSGGVAWGRGLNPPQPGLQKVEGDDRSPAGVFRIGDSYGDAPQLTVDWPYHPVTPRDLWFEDPASPRYNVHVQVAGDRPLTPEEAKAVMRRGDPAHALKVFVEHNAPPDVVPGAGSAIFLHIWRRDGAAPTVGCTAMAKGDLEALVGWLDPDRDPVFALLTSADLARVGADWGLPIP